MSVPAVQFYDDHPGTASLRDAVLPGLARTPKAIPPKFFYDEHGSELFDAICDQPEYYPTRTEIGILQTHAREIAELAGEQCLLIELGSGASKKIRLLLESLRPSAYLGVDISKEFLLTSTRRLAEDFPWLDVHAACADFSKPWQPAFQPDHLRSLGFFPGSSIGNFEPAEAEVFLGRLSRILGDGGALLIGVDLKKDPAILNAAYNDAAGVTAAFNLNLLSRIQSELVTDLNVEQFSHRAFYNEQLGRIEMHLVSNIDQSVRVADRVFKFAGGETIHTECSYKYTIEEFQALAGRAGFRPMKVWTDSRQLFSVHFLVATGTG